MSEEMPERPYRSIFLLADSQLLFWRENGELFLNRVRRALYQKPRGPLKAAYLGAANGDKPEFYDIFLAAMSGIDCHDCRMIPSAPSESDYAYLDEADIVLIAGGDVKLGWDAFKASGLNTKILERYYAGTILIGVSAGAIILGQQGWSESNESEDTFSTMQLVPFVIDAHDDPDWRRLSRAVSKMGEHGRGLGIPAGSGAIFHADWTLEPVRHPVVEFTVGDDGVRRSLLFPPNSTSPTPEDAQE